MTYKSGVVTPSSPGSSELNTGLRSFRFPSLPVPLRQRSTSTFLNSSTQKTVGHGVCSGCPHSPVGLGRTPQPHPLQEAPEPKVLSGLAIPSCSSQPHPG